MSTLNIKFTDGNELISYDDDSYHYDGCPTCNYGSEYINEITIKTTNYTIDIKLNQMYDYAFSQADAIKIFAGADLRQMNESEFIDYIEKTFKEGKWNTDSWCWCPESLQKFEVNKNS